MILDPDTNLIKTKFRPIEIDPSIKTIPGALLIKFEEGLFFGNVQSLKDRLKRAEKYGNLNTHPSTLVDSNEASNDYVFCDQQQVNENELKYVLFDVKAMTSIDARF